MWHVKEGKDEEREEVGNTTGRKGMLHAIIPESERLML